MFSQRSLHFHFVEHCTNVRIRVKAFTWNVGWKDWFSDRWATLWCRPAIHRVRYSLERHRTSGPDRKLIHWCDHQVHCRRAPTSSRLRLCSTKFESWLTAQAMIEKLTPWIHMRNVMHKLRLKSPERMSWQFTVTVDLNPRTCQRAWKKSTLIWSIAMKRANTKCELEVVSYKCT